jgi:hypothetical protein
MDEFPKLPLFDAAAGPDDWHRITSPGGYESWIFHAVMPATEEGGDVLLSVSFYVGDVLSRDYARDYVLYRRRPTRHRPPQPSEFAGVRACVIEKGKSLAQIVIPAPGGKVSASNFGVLMGENQLILERRGFHLKFSDPGGVSADFYFGSRLKREPENRKLADHHLLVCIPVCAVKGMIQQEGRSIAFRGWGSVEHFCGTAPSPFRWMIRGRVLEPMKTTLFLATEPATYLIAADGDGVRDGEGEGVIMEGAMWLNCRIGHPMVIRIGPNAYGRPKRLARSPAELHVLYERLDGVGPPLWCQINRLPGSTV